MIEPGSNVPALSVSELNHQAKILLESHFDYVRVEGEIGDFTAASSGHWYFTLKDASAQVRCAMFKGANSKVKLRPTKGDSVRLRARVSLYENRGEYQLIAQHMEAAGDGALQAAFERLKARLQAEGLFEQSRKRPIPEAARRVGVVTSATGAAIHDILSVLSRRSPMTEVFLFPVPVQGNEAAPAIVNAIAQANQLHATGALPLDVLIVGRGGGSLEDLWAFNEESVARAVAASVLPIVSAVGHEVDFSIADFVADRRAATPSAAAELISIDQQEWLQHFDRIQLALKAAITRKIRREQEQLKHLRARLRHPGATLARQRRDLEATKRNLQRALQSKLRTEKAQLQSLQVRLRGRHPKVALNRALNEVTQYERRLIQSMEQRLRTARTTLLQQKRLLESLGPESTLARGYAIVTTDDQKIIRSADQTQVGAALNIKLNTGRLGVSVESVDTDTKA